MEKCNDKINRTLYFLGWFLLFAAVGFYFLVTQTAFFRNMPCRFRLATGLYCPGCGATRAFYLLLHGKFLTALAYYPAVPYGAVLYVWFMISNTIELLSRKKYTIGLCCRNLYLYAALVLILGNWLVKNLLLLL